MYCTTGMDDCAGPPFVMTNGSVKSWNAPMVWRMNRKKVVGLIIGTVTLRKRCQAPGAVHVRGIVQFRGTPCSAAR